MLTRSTVLVLGAGASKPYGLPLGSELRDEVLRTSDSFAHAQALRDRGNSDADFTQFAEDLASSGFSSVDAFLEDRPHWTGIGKTAMALSLLSSEFRSRPRLLPPNQPRDHWLQVLWSRIKAPDWQSLLGQGFGIVTFNYDRLVEHYLTTVISNNYQMSPATVADSLPIIHVHGSLGRYDARWFGAPVTDGVLDEASTSIRVVHEAEWQHSEFAVARQMVEQAEQVIFVGLGFLDANMRKLGFDERASALDKPAVVATHKGIKSPQWRRLCAQYHFSPEATTAGAGSISELISDFLV